MKSNISDVDKNNYLLNIFEQNNICLKIVNKNVVLIKF